MNNIEKNNWEITIVNLICKNIFRLIEMSFFIYSKFQSFHCILGHICLDNICECACLYMYTNILYVFPDNWWILQFYMTCTDKSINWYSVFFWRLFGNTLWFIKIFIFFAWNFMCSNAVCVLVHFMKYVTFENNGTFTLHNSWFNNSPWSYLTCCYPAACSNYFSNLP